MRSLNGLAWRALLAHPARTLSNAVAVALGTAVILAAGITSSGILGLQPEANRLAGFIRVIGGTAEAAGMVVIAAAGFLILNAFAISVLHRRREIGLQRALGMTRRQTLLLLLRETLGIALLGTALGLALGPLLGAGLLRLVARYGVEVSRGRLSAGNALLAAGAGVCIPIMAVLIPAGRAARLAPLAALREQTAAPPRHIQARVPGWVGLGIMSLLALYLVLAPPGEWTGYHPPWQWAMPLLLSIPWLIALALILPALIGSTARIAKRLLRRQGAVGRLAADNLGREPRRARLSALSFAVGLGAISALSGALHFNNHVLIYEVTRGMLEQTAWFFNPFDATTGLAQLDEFGDTLLGISPQVRAEVEHVAAGRARVVETYMVYLPEIGSPIPGFPSWMLDPEALDRPGVYTFVQGDWETARPLLVGSLDQSEPWCALLVPPTVAAQHHADVGGTIHVRGRDGVVPCTVAGIGYGGLTPMSIVNPGARELLDAGLPFSLIVWPLPGADVPALDADLHALADRMPDQVFISTADQQVDSIIQTSDQLQGMASGLMALAVAAAGLGLTNITAMNIAERRHELGLLRAAGATRRQVQAAVAGEAALLGLIGGVVGLLGGVGVAAIYCLSFGGIPFGLVDLDLWRGTAQALQPALVSGLLGIAIMPCLGAAAAWLPARAALRGTAVETLQAERRPTRTRSPRRQRGIWCLLLTRRGLEQTPVRTVLGILTVALGTATVVATGVTSTGVRAGIAAEVQEQIAFVSDMVGVGLGVAGAMILAAGGFLIYNAFGMSVTERQRQIGLLRSLGMARRQVLRMVLAEALAVGGAGTLCGVLTGPLLGSGVLAGMRAAGYTVGTGSVSLPVLALATFMGIAITLFSALLPARRAARISPLAALHSEAGDGTHRASRGRLILGTGVIACMAVYLAAAPPGRWTLDPWNYVLPISLWVPWLGALLSIAPAWIGSVGRVLRAPLARMWRAAGLLAADNVRRARGRVLVTALTFAVSVMTVTGVTGIFTFTGKVLIDHAQQTRFQNGLEPGWSMGAADFTQGVTNIGGMVASLRPEVIAAVRAAAEGRAEVGVEYTVSIPELNAVMVPNYFSSIIDLNLLAVPGNVEFLEGDLASALPMMEAGCGVLLAPGAAARNQVGVGDMLTIQSRDGPIDCRVAGVVAAGMVPVSFISPAAKDHFDVGDPTSLIILPHHGIDRAALEADLQAIDTRFGDDAWLMRTEEGVATVSESADRVLGLMNSVLVLGVLAAALGLVNTTVMSVSERRHELSLFRAVGATQRQVAAVVGGEAALIGLAGALLGMVAGAGIAAIFCLAHGGNAWGYGDLDLGSALGRSLAPATLSGIVGLIVAPPLGAGVAWLASRSLIRGKDEPARVWAVTGRKR